MPSDEVAFIQSYVELQRDLADANATLKAETDAHGNTLRLLAAASARIAELEQEKDDICTTKDQAWQEQWEAVRAANARISKIEGLLRAELKMHHDTRLRELAANAQVEGTMNQLRSQERLTAAANARLADYQAMVDDLDTPDILIHWREDRKALAARDGQVAALTDDLEAANARADAATDAMNVEQARRETEQKLRELAQARADEAERATEAAIAGNSLATQRARSAEARAEEVENTLSSAETYIAKANVRNEKARREAKSRRVKP
jgi:chromosome segregation ATPase